MIPVIPMGAMGDMGAMRAMRAILARPLALFLFLICAATSVAAQEGSAPVPAPWQVQGAGPMRWLGFTLYDARLWTPPEAPLPASRAPDAGASFALELRYARDIPGTRLVDASLDELRRLGWSDNARLQRWSEELARVFPDVRAGEVIVGRHLPGGQAEFFHQGRPTGRLADPALATAFFAIWLDPRTREPGLRARLLGVGG